MLVDVCVLVGKVKIKGKCTFGDLELSLSCCRKQNKKCLLFKLCLVMAQGLIHGAFIALLQ